MAKMTTKNTKNEILEAYESILNQLKEAKEGKTTTADVVKAKEVKAVKEAAKEIVELNILNDEMTKKYESLIATIEMLEKDIEELYGIKVEADSLEALINAHKDKSKELDAAYSEKLAKLNAEYSERAEIHKKEDEKLRTDLRKLSEECRAQYKEETAKLEKQRAREKEEYTYDLKRQRAIENDKWEDEKASRESELAAKESAVAAREALATEKDNKITTLELEVNTLNDRMEAVKATAFEEGKVKAKKEADTSKVFSDRAHKAELDRKEDLIASLQSSNQDLKSANSTLQDKLDAAYTRIQEMAIEAAKNSGTKVIESSK